jgi:uncharacterized protein
MEKSFAVESVEVFGEAGSGKFEALVSVFGNIDAVKDVVIPGAFTKSINELDPPPVVWSHYWNIPPIGDTIDWSESGKGLQIKGELFVGADDRHQYADMVYAAMKSRNGRKPALREFSFSYDIPEGGQMTALREIEGKTIEVNELHTIFPVDEVGPCLKGCNPATELITAPKTLQGLSLDDQTRIIAIAKARGLSLDELLAALEAEGGESAFEPHAAEMMMAELMLAFPDH